MKKLFLLATIAAVALTACKQTTEPVDMEAEKEAIMKVIQNESEFARDAKFEEFVNLYVHDEFNTRLRFLPDTFEIIKGWENVRNRLAYIDDREETELTTVNVSKENPLVKITGNTAWVVCDNIWQGEYEGEEIYNESLQVTFLEKSEGEWKISLAGWFSKPEPDDDDEDDAEDEDEEEEEED
ncbi:MAG: hypothetical protein ACQERS_10925 [Bacteroidota bacterium]